MRIGTQLITGEYCVPLARLLILLILAGFLDIAEAKDIAVISYKGNAVSSLSLVELLKLCNGQTARWPDGKPVSCVIRQPGSPEMKVVLEKVYNSPTDELATTIATANRGRGNHPAIIVMDSNDALVKKVESTPGSIGMVDVYSITGGVTVIRVGGKLPLEPGYPIHGN
jgi:ABC-type phosphate transport system substrate-binding protein